MASGSKARRRAARLAEFAHGKPPPPPAPKTAGTASGPRPHERAGTRVAVIREEHGWHDGRVTGVLIDDSGSVRVDADDPHFAGLVFECRKRRDYHVLPA